MKVVFFVACLLIVAILSYLTSFDKKAVKSNINKVGIVLLLEIGVSYFLLNTSIGVFITLTISKYFNMIMEYANEGISFVFGDLTKVGSSVFLFSALMPVVFMCTLIGILKYFKILDFFSKWVGIGLNKLSGLGIIESSTVVNSFILGMQPVYVSIKDVIPKLSEKRIFTIGVASISSIAIFVVGAYLSMMKPEYVILAIVLNMLSVFFIMGIISPINDEKELNEESDERLNESSESEKESTSTPAVTLEEKRTFFEVLSDYMTEGFQIILSVIPMLLGFISLIALLNGVFNGILGISFQTLIGYLFSPVAFILGIPWNEAVDAGGIMSIKLLTNEFVGMTELLKLSSLSERTVAILTVYLMSYANFGSIAIIIGVVKSISKEKSKFIVKNGLKILYVSTLVSFLSSAVFALVV